MKLSFHYEHYGLPVYCLRIQKLGSYIHTWHSQVLCGSVSRRDDDITRYDISVVVFWGQHIMTSDRSGCSVKGYTQSFISTVVLCSRYGLISNSTEEMLTTAALMV